MDGGGRDIDRDRQTERHGSRGPSAAGARRRSSVGPLGLLSRPSGDRPALAQGRRRPGAAAAAAVERGGDVQREAGRGAADGCLDLAVDRLGPDHEAGLQARPYAAALIDAAQGVVRLAEVRGHAVNLPAEPAHREQHAPSHLTPERLGEGETRARDVDPQSVGGGMVPELPSRLVAV